MAEGAHAAAAASGPAKPALRVFINCPYDPEYKPLMEAAIFTVFACGFQPCMALDIDDGNLRLPIIVEMIRTCHYGIHDLSRMAADEQTQLARFNMAFELGLFLGARSFGGRAQKRKRCLVLDAEPDRYRRALSDLAGQDIKVHQNTPRGVIREVRNWLRAQEMAADLDGADAISDRYEMFRLELPELCRIGKKNPDALTHHDYVNLVERWLAAEMKARSGQD